MVDCPKCGFTQPQDRYCANCGVDMVTYVPAEKPLLRRLISNVAVQICVIAGVVFAFFLIVRHQQRMDLASRVAELERSEPKEIVESSHQDGELAANPAGSEAKSNSRRRRKPSEAAALLNTGANTGANAPTEMPPDETNAANTETRAAAPAPSPKASAKPSGDAADSAEGVALTSVIRATFNEVPRMVAEELNTGVAGSYGTLRYGVINDFVVRQRAARTMVNWRTLDTSTPQSIKTGETTTIFRGPHIEATGESFGVWVYTKLVKVDDTSVTLQLDVSRNLTSPGSTGGIEQINHLPLPEVVVPKGSAIFVTGLIPHRQAQLTPAEQRLYRSDRVLQVITSEPFRAGATDFVIFIEPLPNTGK